MNQISDWRIYEDRHMGEMTFFVGRACWQTATSYTYHVSDECFSRREAEQALTWARTLTTEQADAAKRGTDTWGRFEAACEAAGIADPF